MSVYTERLAALRAALTAQSLDGFILPMADAYLNEYLPPSEQRIAFLTGFTGSAAVVVVLAEKAVFFTDSRYTLQAQQQVPTERYAVLDTANKLPRDWLAAELPAGARLGYDPWLHAAEGIRRLAKAAPDLTLVPLDTNPIDALWTERPAPPCTPISLHGVEFSGRESSDKRAALAEDLAKKKVQTLVLTDPASIAWLLNVRGGDVPHSPLPLSFALLRADASVDWFVDARKISPELCAALGEAIRPQPPEAFLPELQQHGQAQAAVQLDPNLCASAIVTVLHDAGAKIIEVDDPCILPRACKNPVERAGTIAAHRRDAAALATFFAWLADQPIGSVTELQAEARLEQERAKQNLFAGASFATIAGSGAHGAIVHYRATIATDRALQAGELFLLDSGGQYRDGTTDVTRTVAIGTPTAEMRANYTRVVKGHIALAALRFPPNTTGAEIDVLARQYLWAAGLDYGHGTGHGVGSYLNVHEGPQGISRRANAVLLPGMIVSNEPGYYRTGHYGIRFENLMLVTEPNVPEGGELPMLGFTVLTLAPLDRALLDATMLTPPERAWIDAYHARIRAEVTELSPAARAWLWAVTEAL